MLRKVGFLNLNQIREFVYRELEDEIERVKNTDGLPTGKDCARVWAEWQWRVIIDDSNEVYLFNHASETVCMDSDLIFLTRPSFAIHNSEIVLNEPLTATGLAEFERQLSQAWEFVDPVLGIIEVRSKPAWRTMFRKDWKREQENRLRVFNGWTVAIAEKSVLESLDWIRKCLREYRGGEPDDGTLRTVLSTYRQAYPDGKGTATWAEVEKRTGFSRRHLTRALKHYPQEK